ncbi:MAG: thioredoxin family protein [Paludibacteraceae bacterium]|nr:thioredoxin family protein [Paludibacteraceae bacterium]
MRRKILLSLLVLISTTALFSQIFEPIKWSFELKNTGKTTADIILKATIDGGWHLYGMNIPEGGPRPTSFVFEGVQNAKLEGKVQSQSKLKEVYDPNFDMKLSWYANEAVFVQKISFADASKVRVKGYVEFMACDDQSCLPPAQESFDLGSKNVQVAETTTSNTPATTEVKALETLAVADSSNTETTQETKTTEVADYWTPVIDQLNAFGNMLGNVDTVSLWLIFLAGLGGGFLALFTPCVWPIIPMTVSFFLKRSGNKSKGRRDAILYGLSIVVIYVALGLLITLLFGSSALNSMSTNAVFNLIFFGLLVFFAVSFFGAFEITLPSSWSTKLDAKAEATSGILSILFMAFVLALVSFSCTGPIIGTLLVEVASTGSLLAPAVGMFGFAVALAIPFTFFAFFPSLLKSMPKSGGWLNTVKVVLAFLELALALKFLSVADLAYGWRILDREVFLVLWIVIFALLGFYLLGKIRFPHDSESKHSSVPGTFLAIVSLSFSLYMVPGLWGAPLKAISAFAPPLYTQDFNLYDNEVHAAYTDYEEGMAYAASKELPVVVDFSGFGCVNCRKMEASVWTDPRVKDKLEKEYVLITLFVDDKTPLKAPYSVEENGKTRQIKSVGDKWSYLQRHKFGSNAQPFYVILDNQGMPLNKSYSFDESPDNFLKWLGETRKAE